MSTDVDAIPSRSSRIRTASGQSARAFPGVDVGRRALERPSAVHVRMTSSATSYALLPAHGPIAALIDAGSAPNFSRIISIVARTMSEPIPRQPAWIAAQVREALQRTRSGTQSAVKITGTSMGSAQTIASASITAPSTHSRATTHRPPCTCRVCAGRAASPARCWAIHRAVGASRDENQCETRRSRKSGETHPGATISDSGLWCVPSKRVKHLEFDDYVGGGHKN